ncbi:Uncharacterized protein APZ42_016727 [Daphnia magna]|uniref:Uncharacterized protein n=1 Tax=Daphnia magna TaxID=35525 RepID=A0A0P6A7I0_9CRUS|nr:Uncharacterized protein APZ42_016727 [Daphnia magna]
MMIFQKNKNRKQKRRVKFGKETEEAEAAALRCCSGMRFAARTTPVSHGRPAAFRYYPTSSSSLLWPTSSSPPPTSSNPPFYALQATQFFDCRRFGKAQRWAKIEEKERS